MKRRLTRSKLAGTSLANAKNNSPGGGGTNAPTESLPARARCPIAISNSATIVAIWVWCRGIAPPHRGTFPRSKNIKAPPQITNSVADYNSSPLLPEHCLRVLAYTHHGTKKTVDQQRTVW